MSNYILIFVLFQKWKDYSFGCQTIDTLHLSQRYTTSSTGYYMATSQLSLKKEL